MYINMYIWSFLYVWYQLCVNVCTILKTGFIIYIYVDCGCILSIMQMYVKCTVWIHDVWYEI